MTTAALTTAVYTAPNPHHGATLHWSSGLPYDFLLLLRWFFPPPTELPSLVRSTCHPTCQPTESDCDYLSSLCSFNGLPSFTVLGFTTMVARAGWGGHTFVKRLGKLLVRNDRIIYRTCCWLFQDLVSICSTDRQCVHIQWQPLLKQFISRLKQWSLQRPFIHKGNQALTKRCRVTLSAITCDAAFGQDTRSDHTGHISCGGGVTLTVAVDIYSLPPAETFTGTLSLATSTFRIPILVRPWRGPVCPCRCMYRSLCKQS